MALMKILTYPDPRLRKKSLEHTEFGVSAETLSANMLETMYDSKGIGLAAPQVGVLSRLVVIDTSIVGDSAEDTKSREIESKDTGLTELEEKIEQPLILINPEVTFKEGEIQYDEGCLSVPGFYDTVKRFEHIKVKYVNTAGEPQELETDGLLSICIQHEIDHLDGKLFIDRLSLIKSNRIKNKIKKLGYPEKKSSDDKES